MGYTHVSLGLSGGHTPLGASLEWLGATQRVAWAVRPLLAGRSWCIQDSWLCGQGSDQQAEGYTDAAKGTVGIDLCKIEW